MHLQETVLHGWDLARATGQDPGFDPEVVEAAERLARSSMPERRPPGTPFADAVEAQPDASAIDRLAAFAGRRA
jgi:uncharacterized protein (TIGR03086 family)